MSVEETRNVSTFEQRTSRRVDSQSRWKELRDKFDKEVKKVEDEMDRLKTNFSTLRTRTR